MIVKYVYNPIRPIDTFKMHKILMRDATFSCHCKGTPFILCNLLLFSPFGVDYTFLWALSFSIELHLLMVRFINSMQFKCQTIPTDSINWHVQEPHSSLIFLFNFFMIISLWYVHVQFLFDTLLRLFILLFDFEGKSDACLIQRSYGKFV